MSTLLLRLAAPLQSYGAEAGFNIRRTMPMPTKSAIVGLLAAALGRRRDDPVEDLSSLRFGARADQPGKDTVDYQTIHSRPEEIKCKKDEVSVVSHRHYLEDAVFVAGIEGDEAELRMLEEALKNPVYHLFLGRKCCPPEQPLVLGIRNKGLLEALQTEPWQAGLPEKRKTQKRKVWLRIQTDADTITDELGCKTINDLPVKFSITDREHAIRFVQESSVCILNDQIKEKPEPAKVCHDPFADL